MMTLPGHPYVFSQEEAEALAAGGEGSDFHLLHELRTISREMALSNQDARSEFPFDKRCAGVGIALGCSLSGLRRAAVLLPADCPPACHADAAELPPSPQWQCCFVDRLMAIPALRAVRFAACMLPYPAAFSQCLLRLTHASYSPFPARSALALIDEAVSRGVLPSYKVDDALSIDMRSMPPTIAEVYVHAILNAVEQRVGSSGRFSAQVSGVGGCMPVSMACG